MAVTFDGSDGLFTRLGKIGHVLNITNTFRGVNSSGNLPAEIEDIIEEYDGETPTIRGTVDALVDALTSAQGGLSSLLGSLRTAAQQTLIEMVYADVLANGAVLNPMRTKALSEAIEELIAQMLAGSETVDATEPSIAASAGGSNAGNGACVTSVLDAYGRRLENCLPEKIVAVCTDSTTSGQESFAFSGEVAVSDRLSHDWPGGSGASANLTAIDAATSSSSQNLLTNGDFEDFAVANTPDGWTIVTGSAGTQILSESSIIYKGSKALEYDGDGSNLTQIKQAITGLSSRTPYAVNLWAKVDVSPAAGVLVIDLYDGSNVINDDQGTANSLSIDLTTIGTSYVAKNTVFRLPDPVPATVQLRIRLSTALSSGSSAFVDHLAFAPATQLYTGGPYAALFSGATDWELDDKFGVTVTNAQAGAFQTLFDRLFDMRNKGLLLPSATGAAETIDDALIG